MIYDFPVVIVWIWFLFWLITLILSLSNLSCISFNIVYVGVASCIFDFAAFIGIIKGWSKDLADDDDDKVGENFEEKVDFWCFSYLPSWGRRKQKFRNFCCLLT